MVGCVSTIYVHVCGLCSDNEQSPCEDNLKGKWRVDTLLREWSSVDDVQDITQLQVIVGVTWSGMS